MSGHIAQENICAPGKPFAPDNIDLTLAIKGAMLPAAASMIPGVRVPGLPRLESSAQK